MDTKAITSRSLYDASVAGIATSGGGTGQSDLFAALFSRLATGAAQQTTQATWQTVASVAAAPLPTAAPLPPEATQAPAPVSDSTDDGSRSSASQSTADQTPSTRASDRQSDRPVQSTRHERRDGVSAKVTAKGTKSTRTAQGNQADRTDQTDQTDQTNSADTASSTDDTDAKAASSQSKTSDKDADKTKDQSTGDPNTVQLIPTMVAQAVPQAAPALGSGAITVAGAGGGPASAPGGSGKVGSDVVSLGGKAGSGPVPTDGAKAGFATVAAGPMAGDGKAVADGAGKLGAIKPGAVTAKGKGQADLAALGLSGASGTDAAADADPAAAEASSGTDGKTDPGAAKTFLATLGGTSSAALVLPPGMRTVADLLPPTAAPKGIESALASDGGDKAGDGQSDLGNNAGTPKGQSSSVSQDGANPTMAGAGDTAKLVDGQDFASQLANVRGSRSAMPAGATEQVTVQMQRALKDGNNSITMQLRPEELGRIDVRLDIDKEGKVSAMITAERPQTLELLQKDSHTLEKALQDAGLQTDTASLNFSMRGDGGQAGQGFNQQGDQSGSAWGNGARRGATGSAASDDESTVDPRIVLRRYQVAPGRVDVRI